MKNKRVLWIVRTAICIALLLVLQVATSGFGNTLLTGSLVNMMLAISVLSGGFLTGLTVALVSPVAAKLLGIGPLWSLIPFIAAGNAVLVLVWALVAKREWPNKLVARIAAAILAALAKFGVLFLGIVKLAVPILLKLPDPQASTISAMFSVPQLVTALIGGGIALIVWPLVERALRVKGAG